MLHFQEIDFKFLVVGPSKMERHFVYSATTQEIKGIGQIRWPEACKSVAKSARRKGDTPYLVH